MKKVLLLIILIFSLFTSCSPNYVFSQYEGYEYVINEGEDLFRTYSFFGEKADAILKDEVKEEYKETIFYVTSFNELERLTNTKKLKDILGNDIFGSSYLALCQRSDEFDSVFALNCVYLPLIKLQDTYSGTGWVDKSDLYLEVNRYFISRKSDPEIVNNYVLDIIILPKDKVEFSLINQEYANEIKVDHYEDNLIVSKNDIDYLYNKRNNSYAVYRIESENFEIEKSIKNKPVDRIIHHAFYNNQKVEHIVIPSNIIKIGNSAFQGCLNLKSITFEENSKLEIIGSKAFYGAFITHLNVPSSCKYILNGAFGYCINLRTITFEEDSLLEEIGNKAFYNCSSLDGIVLPMKLQKVGNEVFYNTYMQYVYIPSSVLYMGENVFTNEENSELKLEIEFRGDKIPSTWSSSWNEKLNYSIYYNCLPRV